MEPSTIQSWSFVVSEILRDDRHVLSEEFFHWVPDSVSGCRTKMLSFVVSAARL